MRVKDIRGTSEKERAVGFAPKDTSEDSKRSAESIETSTEEHDESVNVLGYLEDYDKFHVVSFQDKPEFDRRVEDGEIESISLSEYLKDNTCPAVAVRDPSKLDESDIDSLEENYGAPREVVDIEGYTRAVVYGCPEHDGRTLNSGETVDGTITFEQAKEKLER